MQITLRSDGREIKSHGDYAFPVLVSPERLDAYEMGSFACHWHPEIEFTLILTGEILYQVNDRTYHLKKGEGVFCNANMLHTGRHADSHDCTYLSVTVNPSLLYGYEASLLQTKFIQPVTENPLLPSASFSREAPWEREVLSHLDTIRQSIPLLVQGKDSITDISLQCGFSSPSYYTKLFRKFMGCTPREYTKSVHAKKQS